MNLFRCFVCDFTSDDEIEASAHWEATFHMLEMRCDSTIDHLSPAYHPWYPEMDSEEGN